MFSTDTVRSFVLGKSLEINGVPVVLVLAGIEQMRNLNSTGINVSWKRILCQRFAFQSYDTGTTSYRGSSLGGMHHTPV